MGLLLPMRCGVLQAERSGGCLNGVRQCSAVAVAERDAMPPAHNLTALV